MPPRPRPAPPRPRLAARTTGLRQSLYARILGRLEAFEGEVFPFHIGESHRPPEQPIRDALKAADERGVHRYSHPQGVPGLRAALAGYVRGRGSPGVDAGDVMVVHGATHGLNLACQALLDPEDEVIVLSPHWPLINGMVRAACGVPVEVPFTSGAGRPDGGELASWLTGHLSPRTRAIYVTTPNNPDGVVLDDATLRAIASVCVSHDLYALVDAAYERFVYKDRPVELSELPGMTVRTIRVFSFSKSHRMAGLRAGFVVAPPDVLEAMTRLANLSIYNVSLLVQRAALAATEAEAAVEETVAESRAARDLLCEALAGIPGVRFKVPDGGAYVFADLDGLLAGRDCFELLERCIEQGIVFSPGEGFGAAYGRWARFCFTALEPEQLVRGAAKLRAALCAFGEGRL